MRITHPEEVASEAVRRGALPSFHERLRNMARYAMCEKGHPNGDHINSPVVGRRVADQWPVRGSGTLTLENGKKKRLFHVNKTSRKPGEFKIKDVK